MTLAFDVGDEIVIFHRFSVGTEPSDPALVIFRVMAPNGVETSYTFGVDPEVTRVVLGEYELTFVPTMGGFYHWRCEGSGGLNVVTEGSVAVRYSAFPV